jgi:hypothetical protein
MKTPPYVAPLFLAALLAACGGNTASSPNTFTISASVSGLTGSGLSIILNGTATAVGADGPITLGSELAAGTSYALTIDTQPVNPVQTCALSNESGTVENADVSIAISCASGTASTVNAARVTVVVDAALPQASAAIVNVISPIDMQKPGSLIYMPVSGSDGESAVVAVDASGNIVLASLSTVTTINLTADSTALFLVRMILGAMPDTGTASDVNSAIRATAEYPSLVALITANVAANMPAPTSMVYASIDTVFSQLPTEILQTLSAQHRVGESAPLLLHANGTPVATPNLNAPRNLFTTSAAGHVIGAVAITGTTADGSLTATNTTAIAWSIASADTSGAPICPVGGTTSSGNPDCSVTLERTSLAKQIVSTSVSTATVPGNGDAFNITLEQTLVSRTQNVVQSVEDTATTVLAVATAGESLPFEGCLDTAVEKFLKPADIANLVAEPTGDGFNAYFQSVFTTSTVFGMAKGCASVVAPLIPASATSSAPIAFAQSVAAFISGFSDYVKNSFGSGIVGATLAGVNAFGIPLEIAQAYSAWNASFTVGVCEGGAPLAITDCAVSLTFNPSPEIVSGGTIFQPVITARDSAGNPTLAPPDLLFLSSNPSVVAVDAISGVATSQSLPFGAPTASATVTATDGNTGLTGSYTVSVTSEGGSYIGTGIGSGTMDFYQGQSGACSADGTTTWTDVSITLTSATSGVLTATGNASFPVNSDGCGATGVVTTSIQLDLTLDGDVITTTTQFYTLNLSLAGNAISGTWTSSAPDTIAPSVIVYHLSGTLNAVKP